ncbi:MAG: AI-2E family transporter [Calditrichia bacterium]
MGSFFTRGQKMILAGIVGVGALAFLFAIGDLVQIIIIAALLAYILDPLVNMIEARGMSRTLSAVILFGIISGIVGIGFLLLAPVFTVEVKSMRGGFGPENAKQLILTLEAYLKSNFSFLGIGDLNLVENLSQVVVEFGNFLFTNVSSLVGILANLVILPFITFFLLKDGREIKKGLVAAIPNRYFEFSLNLLYKMDKQLGNYLRGQILDALVIGILSMTAMALLGVKYAIIIGGFAGLFNLIPYVGPLAGALLAISVTLVESGDASMLLPIAGAFAIVQLMDNVLVQPTIVAKNVDLPPLVVLLVVIVGGKFFGILGMILCVPLTAIVKVLFQEALPMYRKYRFTS